MPVSSPRLCLSASVPPTICLSELRPSRRRRPFDGARALKTRPFNLSNPEIQWKFVRRKFLHGAEEGRIFIEDIFDGVWSFGRSTKTSFKLSLPKKEKGKGVVEDVDQSESCVDSAVALCTSAEGASREVSGRLDFVFLWLTHSSKVDSRTVSRNWVSGCLMLKWSMCSVCHC